MNNANHKWLIVITIMLVAILEVLDSIIVSVALPNMMGELGANSDQITWVLTSYIVASAIFMPLTGFMGNRIGVKNLLLVAILGFMASSMLCGLANTLELMIFFRILQGSFGAFLIPLSQTILRDTFPLKEQGKAMAIWGIGVMAAPVLGPTLGGYIVDLANWRWIFYINLPVCLISFFLALVVIQKGEKRREPIDWLGLVLMAAAVGGLQMFLDQGNQKNWFNSTFILWLFILSIFCLMVFVLRSLSEENTILNFKLFANRNFSGSSLLLIIYAACIFSTISIQPIQLERLFNYPPETAGLVMMPRGIASAIAMMIVAPLMQRIPIKYLLVAGILMSGAGTYLMSQLNLNANAAQIAFPGIIQGFGLGLFFPPLATTSLSTLPKRYNPEGAGLFSYSRMLGTSIGISVFSTIISRETQINWQTLGAHIQPFNPALQHWLSLQHLNMSNKLAIQQLAGIVGGQANMIAFNDGYYAMALGIFALIPLVFVIGKVDLSKDQPDEFLH